MKMTKPKVIILTEGDTYTGHGHVTRCVSLYQAFQETGIKPALLIKGDDTVIPLVRFLDYRIVDWFDLKFLKDEIKRADIVVVDSYKADISIYELISEYVAVPVYIDDTKRLNYPKGVVVNGSIYAKEIGYPEKEDVFYLLGTDYTPLRREFWNVPEKSIEGDLATIMITFGGNDTRCLTPRVLEALCEEFSQIEKVVVVGGGFRREEVERIEKIADGNTKLVRSPTAELMKRVMLEADVAVSAGGQTLYELARIGTPTVAVAVADNQLGNVTGWSKTGFAEYAGWWEDDRVIDRIVDFIETLYPVEERKKRYFTGRRFVDGKGSLRVVSFIIKLLKGHEP